MTLLNDGEAGAICAAPDTECARVGLLGAGRQAAEIASYLPSGTEIFYAVSPGYLDSSMPNHIDITAPTPTDRDTRVVAASGIPVLRRFFVDQWPGDRFLTVVSPAAYVDPSCAIGDGTVIAPGAILAVDVTIGRHSYVNIGATLSHDVQLGSFVTIGPGSNVAGQVCLGDGVYVGVGASIKNGVTLAPGVVVGAGAAVLRDVETPNAVVVGVPAAVIKVREGWLDAV